MKHVLTITLLINLLLYSCGGNKRGERGDPKGGVSFGGIIKVNELEEVKNLLPFSISELNCYHVASQVYEGLVRYSSADLSIQPGIARSWDISEDKTEYTFHIRPDVMYHNDACFKDGKGRSVVAADIKFCYEKLCTPSLYNAQYEVTFKDRVEGANDFYDESQSGRITAIRGITITDDSTIKLKLLQPNANFLAILAMPGCYIYPPEAFSKYGPEGLKTKVVGTGPFYLESFAPGKGIIMKRNTEYWAFDKNGNQLPYLDGIQWSYINNKGAEVSEFSAGKLDVVYNVPSALMSNLMTQSGGKIPFDIHTSPALTTEYYCFNEQVNAFFSMKEVRQAFNLAIDRRKILESALRGEGRMADYGLVPFTEVFAKSGYDYKAVGPFPYLPDSARKLLAAAGYADGKGLPDFNLEINDGGSDRNMRVATEVSNMLKQNLGINLNISIVPWATHIENVQTGKSDFFRYAWVADYPDPESFLTLFYGKHVPENFTDRSYINLAHFKKPAYDSIFEQALAELDNQKRYKLFSSAEKILMSEAAIIPLFYDENSGLVQKNLKNVSVNPLNYLDFSVAYFSAPETAAKK